jgi:hypothetical protein
MGLLSIDVDVLVVRLVGDVVVEVSVDVVVVSEEDDDNVLVVLYVVLLEVLDVRLLI